MNDTSRLNVRNHANCEEVNGEKHKVISNEHSSSQRSQNCTSNTLGNDQECFKGTTIDNVIIMDLKIEESLPHNIKTEETSMISHERFVLHDTYIRMKRYVCFKSLIKEYLYQ